MIALLKVLLAAAPTSRSRNDSLNILVDVLPPEAPANIVESTQVDKKNITMIIITTNIPETAN